MAFKVALALHQKGWDNDRIARHVSKKFNMPYLMVVDEIVPGKWKKHYWYGCGCAECEEARRIERERRKPFDDYHRKRYQREQAEWVEVNGVFLFRMQLGSI